MAVQPLPARPRAARWASASAEETRAGWLAISPWIVGFVIFTLGPIIASLYFSFTSYNVVQPARFIGLENYRRIFMDDPLFRKSLFNTLVYTGLHVPLHVFTAMGAALLLSRAARFQGIFRTLFYLPAMTPAVATALLWLWILNPIYGPLNAILRAVGLPAPAWLVDPHTALLAIVLMSFFQLGEGFVVLLAGLRGIPGELYDAAAIDGGGPWRVFWAITLPLLAPWLLLNTLRDIMLSAQGTFAPAFIMTGGDPYYATLFLPLHIYQVAFGSLRFGQATAMMLLLLGGTALLLLLVYRLLGGWGYDDEL